MTAKRFDGEKKGEIRGKEEISKLGKRLHISFWMGKVQRIQKS